MSKPEQLHGIKWRADQIEADVIDACSRFSVARQEADMKRALAKFGYADVESLEADLRTCMATGEGFELTPEDLLRIRIAVTDDDGRPIER